MKPNLSILIVSWNSWHDLKRCLEALRIDDFPDLEVVVIDNASVDGSAENIRAQFPQVILRENSRNLGHAGAMNQGFRTVQGRYVLILDPDTVIQWESIGMLAEFLDRRPDASIVVPRTYNGDGTVQESAREFPTAASGLFGRQSLLSRWLPNNPFTRRYLMREQLGQTGEFQVGQVSAACILLRRELVDQVGPWDEGYRGYFVDTDWCMTLRKHGKKIFCLPLASVVHYENNRVMRKKSALRIRIFHMGAFRFYRKHHTFGWLDPRTLFAMAALSLRAVVQIALNALRRESTGPAGPPDRTSQATLDRKSR